MSTTESTTSDEEYNSRERAVRVFAAELQDAAGHHFKKDPDSDRAPDYTLLPTGVLANRVLIIGTVTDITEYEDNGFIRARVNDGYKNFDVNVSTKYQRDSAASLRDIDVPEMVAVVGKVKHWESNQTGEQNVEIQQVEEIHPVSLSDRNEWILATAVRTRERVREFHETSQEEIDSGTAPNEVEMVHNSEVGYEDLDHTKYLQAAQESIKSAMNTSD